MDNPQVMIVGAGPTGLVLAIWLAKVGIPFRLIDRKSRPGEASRAIAVQARTLEFYRQLGFVDEVLAGGFRMERLNLRSRNRQIASVNLGDVGKGESPYAFAFSFPQDDHERLLNEQLRRTGHAVEWDTELIGFQHDVESVRATLRKPNGEETWTGAYLCGCDGGHSAVRHALGIGFPGGTYDQLFYVADAEAIGEWSSDEINAHFAEKTFCLALPVRSKGVYRFVGLIPEAMRDQECLSFEDVRADVEEVTGTRVSNVNWFSTYRVHHRVAEHFRQGRAFLAGDAGHVHSPAGGQGMNTGIGDGVNLAWKLAAVLNGRAKPELLETYEAERMPFARSLVATTDRVFDLVVGRGFISKLVRTIIAPHVLPFALGFSAVRRAQFRLVSQTRIAYHKSDLSVGDMSSAQPGDRLPWVEGIDNFRPLASLDWQIHVYGHATPALRQAAETTRIPLHEWPWSDEAKHADLTRDAAYMVRPDGYIGFASTAQDVTDLNSYVTKFGITIR